METNIVDHRRVVQIDRYRVLVEPPRPDLAALVQIAAQVAEVPLATINLITDTEQHQIATAGFDASICAREDSMCNVVIGEMSPVVVPDASRDPRFADNPFVNGEIDAVRFYAAHQLRTPSGVVIGTLCVFDTESRSLTADQESALVGLAARVVDVLELELRTRELSATIKRLQATHAELERSNRQLASFAGQVSHDLRNPLTAMDLSMSMVAEEVEMLAENSDVADLPFLVDRARSGTRRMQALVDELLAFARVGGELQIESVDLNTVLDDVRADLAVQLEGVHLNSEQLPTVQGDPVQLRQVLQNLIANAVAYGGTDSGVDIEIASAPTDLGCKISVIDHGAGVPEDQRTRIFEPLVRLRKEIPGSGIGLATVRQIVEAHGGLLGVVDTPGGGATFWFEVPRRGDS